MIKEHQNWDNESYVHINTSFNHHGQAYQEIKSCFTSEQGLMGCFHHVLSFL